MYRSSATTIVRRVRTARQSSVVAPIVPAVEMQIVNTGENEGGDPNTPRTPEHEQNNVQLVDLITPAVQPQIPVLRARRPLEVDLTCDLDDEVFVVLVYIKTFIIICLCNPINNPFSVGRYSESITKNQLIRSPNHVR